MFWQTFIYTTVIFLLIVGFFHEEALIRFEDRVIRAVAYRIRRRRRIRAAAKQAARRVARETDRARAQQIARRRTAYDPRMEQAPAGVRRVA